MTFGPAAYRGGRVALVGLARLWFRLEVRGKEHVPATGAFVLAPVHRSNLDFLLVSAVTSRRMRYMGKDSLWKNRRFGRLLTGMGAFPVRRGTADREALRQCMEVIREGEPLVLFPEGTRQSGPIVQPLFEGAAFVAGRTQVPIVPVGIGGSERAMPKGSKVIRPVKVVMVVGAPLDPPAPATEGGRPSRRAVHEVTERLHAEIQALFDAAQSAV